MTELVLNSTIHPQSLVVDYNNDYSPVILFMRVKRLKRPSIFSRNNTKQGRTGKAFKLFREDVRTYISDVSIYFQKKLSLTGRSIEGYKGVFVGLLMAKRGRYQGPFLNLSVFMLAAVGIIAAPHISAYYPTLAQGEILSSVAPTTDTVADLNIDQMAMVTQISEKPRDSVLEYTVKSGDTLSSIATTFDISEETIKWANDLTSANPVLKPDQILKIPPVSGIVHKVSRGDTVYTIANKYDTEAQNIVNYPFNDFVDLDNFTLAVGQVLVVPGGVKPAEKKAAPVIRPVAPQYLAGTSKGKFVFPSSGSITQNPVWYHMAIDIANKSAPDVYAAEAGTITLATCYQWGYGCHIIIDHGDGFQTLYAHLSSFYVTGGSVSRGQAIGRMGSTGRSTGTHLHFEVRSGGQLLNPWGYL